MATTKAERPADAATSEAGTETGAETGEAAVESPYGVPGRPFERTDYYRGIFFGLGLFTALLIAYTILRVHGVIVEVVVALFLAAGLNPAVEWLMRRRLKRSYAVLVVILAVLVAIAVFVFAIAPVVSDQVTRIGKNVPTWLNQLEHNKTVLKWNDKYDIITKLQDYITSGDLVKRVFGGALGVGLALLGTLANAFVVTVLTLYFLAGLPTIKGAIYGLAPASRRDRVSKLGDQVLRGVGGYVSGAFIVALCAGLSTLIFLFFAGLKQYAVALAIVVMLLDVIPMIGATMGAVIVSAIGFATSPGTGIACVIFYIAYQQLENYVIYPRVMSRSVDIPGAVTVIAALVGAALLGVMGALLAIPTAAAVLLLVREVFVRRQDQH